MNNILENAEASCVKFAVDAGEAMKLAGISDNVGYIELDARTELKDNEIPAHDIIGLTQFSISEIESHIWEVHFMIGLSTMADQNLFRLRAMANFIYNLVPAGAQLTFYDAETAEEKSWIHVLPGSTQLPTHRVETRPFRFIQVRALLDPLQGVEPDPAP